MASILWYIVDSVTSDVFIVDSPTQPTTSPLSNPVDATKTAILNAIEKNLADNLVGYMVIDASGAVVGFKKSGTVFSRSNQGSILFASMEGSNLGANQTRFLGIGPLNATENQVQLVMTRAGTLQNLSVLPITNTRADTTVVTVRKNAANTAITVSIAAGSTAFAQDTTHTVSVVAGDVVTIQFVTGGGGGNFSASASLDIG